MDIDLQLKLNNIIEFSDDEANYLDQEEFCELLNEEYVKYDLNNELKRHKDPFSKFYHEIEYKNTLFYTFSKVPISDL